MDENMVIEMNQKLEAKKLEAQVDGDKKKFIIVKIGDEKYGIPLYKVMEIIAPTDITPVPFVKKEVKGVLNLRGRIVTVLDLREKLLNRAGDFIEKKTALVILNIKGDSIGAIVDEVDDVINLKLDEISDQVDFQSSIGKEFIKGVARSIDKRLVILIDIDKVMNFKL